jgi:hypothetical protein
MIENRIDRTVFDYFLFRQKFIILKIQFYYEYMSGIFLCKKGSKN